MGCEAEAERARLWSLLFCERDRQSFPMPNHLSPLPLLEKKAHRDGGRRKLPCPLEKPASPASKHTP
jgi:hypothetical protein